MQRRLSLFLILFLLSVSFVVFVPLEAQERPGTSGGGGGGGTTLAQVTNVVTGIGLQKANNLSDVASPGIAAKTIGAYPGTFDPSMFIDTTHKMTAWFKANAAAPLADGTGTNTWIDSSGSGNHATNGTGAHLMVYHPNRLNGLPAFTWTQSGGGTRLSVTNFFSSAYDFNYTMFIVRTPSAASTNISTLISLADGGGSYLSQMTRGLNREATTVLDQAQFDTTSVDPTNSQVVSFRYGADTAHLRVNGFQGGYGSTSLPALNLAGNLKIGSWDGFDGFCWEGDISEILIFNSAFSDKDTALVEKYLSDKYNLGIGKDRILFLGASLTDGYGVDSTAVANAFGSYPYQLWSAVGGSLKWDGVNLGISGQAAETIAANFATALAPGLSGGGRTIAVLWAGDNDMANLSRTPAVAVSNTFLICDWLRERGVEVVLIDTLPGNRGGGWETLRTNFNAIMGSNWMNHASAIFRAGEHPILGDSNNFSVSTWYSSADMIHLTRNSQQIVATNVQDIINRLWRSPAWVATNLTPAVISTNFIGNGVNVTNLNASQLLSGTVPTAQLPSTMNTANLGGATLNATNLAGTIADARLSPNVPLINGVNALTGNSNYVANGIDFTGTTPTITTNGTGVGPASTVTLAAGSTDAHGVITWAPGTGPVAATNYFILTFNRPKNNTPTVFFDYSVNATTPNMTAALDAKAKTLVIPTTTGFSLQGGVTAVTANISRTIEYWVVGN